MFLRDERMLPLRSPLASLSPLPGIEPPSSVTIPWPAATYPWLASVDPRDRSYVSIMLGIGSVKWKSRNR